MKHHQQIFYPHETKRRGRADRRRNLLDEQTRVLALQLLDGNLHLLRGQLPTEDGRGSQVSPIARVARDEEVVRVEEAKDDEAKVIVGQKVAVLLSNW